MHLRGVLPTLALLGLTAACGHQASSHERSADRPGTADCAYVARYAGVTYAEAGSLDEVGEPIGPALVGDCRDVGQDAPGPAFSDRSPMVDAWSVPGAGARQVIAVLDDRSPARWRVLVSDQLSDQATHDLVVRLHLHP